MSPETPAPALKVEGLKVILPTGAILIDELSLEVKPGEAAVILGGSGAGKSTFSRVLFEREALERDGFVVEVRRLDIDREGLGLVPQRGALFDHLDVRGNLELAIQYGQKPSDPMVWLERVGLEKHVADAPVSSLSGGQAQRVAVARALAGGRKLLFLDEPSVGLDPHRVRLLGRLIREQVAGGVAVVVVTHDVALAATVADAIYFLDPTTRRLETLPRPDSAAALDEEIASRIAKAEKQQAPPGKARTRLRLEKITAPFAAAAAGLANFPSQLARHPKDFARVAGRVLQQTVLRPLAFFAIVSSLVGYTILYVISKVGGQGIGSDAGIRIVGGSYVVALAPVLSAMLFVAASGNATNAWLGSMNLTRQVVALEALGVKSRAYLYAPAWLALGLAYLVACALFAFGMLVGGWALCRQLHVAHAWTILTGDLVDPRPERVRWKTRALFLAWVYAWGIASDVVAKGGADKKESDDVTAGMTASVVACTLWVVVWELATAVVAFRT
jgi:ABC-type transporter Mla maintaining outer membrane lipid asymmetry ATPase subunit MlaF/ABC-type transporter Mla maintaining outer membrane lipid asymmetry permease subunit MlaE